MAGIGFVAASFGINYQFAQRSFKLWLIDGGYHAIQFVLCGLILGLGAERFPPPLKKGDRGGFALDLALIAEAKIKGKSPVDPLQRGQKQ